MVYLLVILNGFFKKGLDLLRELSRILMAESPNVFALKWIKNYYILNHNTYKLI